MSDELGPPLLPAPMHVGCPRCGYAFEVEPGVIQAEIPPPELPTTGRDEEPA